MTDSLLFTKLETIVKAIENPEFSFQDYIVSGADLGKQLLAYCRQLPHYMNVEEEAVAKKFLSEEYLAAAAGAKRHIFIASGTDVKIPNLIEAGVYIYRARKDIERAKEIFEVRDTNEIFYQDASYKDALFDVFSLKEGISLVKKYPKTSRQIIPSYFEMREHAKSEEYKKAVEKRDIIRKLMKKPKHL